MVYPLPHPQLARGGSITYLGTGEVLSPASGAPLPKPGTYVPTLGDFVVVFMRGSVGISGGSGGWTNFDNFTDWTASWHLYSKRIDATDVAAWNAGTLTITSGGGSLPVFVHIWRPIGINVTAAVLNSSAGASTGTSLALTTTAMNVNTVMALYFATDQGAQPTSLTFSAGTWVGRAMSNFGSPALYEAYANIPTGAGTLTASNYSGSGNGHYGRLIEIRRS